MRKPHHLAAFYLVVLLLFSLASVLGARATSWAGARPLTPSIEPQWGPDIRVNPTPALTPMRELYKNYSLAIYPTDQNRVLASYDYVGPQTLGIGYAWSTDAGRTWDNHLFDGTWGDDMSPISNASVDFNGQGTAFYSGQATSSMASGYFVLTSTNGTAWNTPVQVVGSDFSRYRDQAHLAIDQRTVGSNAGSVYLTYRYFSNDYQGVWLKYSRNGGSTWSTEVSISDAGNNHAYGPMPVVASNGTVYVAFQELDNGCYCNEPKLYLDSSSDGGMTWGRDQLITGAPISHTGALDVKGRELVLLGDGQGGDVRINHNPSIAVAPNNPNTVSVQIRGREKLVGAGLRACPADAPPNTVYVVWNDGRWDTTFQYFEHQGQHGDIAFSRTTDGGTTWSVPIRINDDPRANGVDQWQPNIAVGPDGIIGVTWYDRRGNPDGFLYDVYYSQSTDGGNTWSVNRKVSDVSSNPIEVTDYKGVGDLGNYNRFVFGLDYALPSWADTRRGHAIEFYTDRGVLAITTSPTPTFTPSALPSFTATQVATISPTSSATSTLVPTATLTASATSTPTRTSTPMITPVLTSTATATFTITATVMSTATASVTPIISPTNTVSASATPTTCPMTFSDVHPGDYFYTAVRYLYCAGAISGYRDGTFRPYNDTTRGQLCKIVVLAEGFRIDTTGGPHFTDVPESNPFYAFIETAYNRGIITGYSDHTFRWGNNVTRAQLCKVIVLAEQWDINTTGGPHFTDVPQSDTFYTFIETAYNRGVISGYSNHTFLPGNNATRGQICKIVYSAVTAP